MDCNGCYGKGWVDSQYVEPVRCPLCKGKGYLLQADGRADSHSTLQCACGPNNGTAGECPMHGYASLQ